VYCGTVSLSGGRGFETGGKVSEEKAREAIETGNNSTNSSNNNVTVRPSVS